MNDSTTGSLVRRKQRCGNCKWFDGENGTGDQSDKGPCRRHPPPVIDRVLPMLLPSSKSTESRFDPIIRVDDQAVYAVRAMDDADTEFRHPWVSGHDWCGEWTAAADDDWEDYEA